LRSVRVNALPVAFLRRLAPGASFLRSAAKRRGTSTGSAPRCAPTSPRLSRQRAVVETLLSTPRRKLSARVRTFICPAAATSHLARRHLQPLAPLFAPPPCCLALRLSTTPDDC